MASGAVVLPMHDRKFSLESSWFGTSNMYNATKFQVQIASTHWEKKKINPVMNSNKMYSSEQNLKLLPSTNWIRFLSYNWIWSWKLYMLVDTSHTNPLNFKKVIHIFCYADMAWEHGNIPSYGSSKYVLSYCATNTQWYYQTNHPKSLKPVDQLDPRRSIGFNWFQVPSPWVPISCSILKSITQFPQFVALCCHVLAMGELFAEHRHSFYFLGAGLRRPSHSSTRYGARQTETNN
jgi:hypothetical protein